MTRRPLVVVTTAAATTLWVTLASAQPAAPRQESASQAADLTFALSRDERGAIGISIHDGLLTLSVDHPSSLVSVLGAIDEQANLQIVGLDAVEGQLVSMKEQTLPLETALRQLLKDYDAFFFYGGDGPSATALTTIWVYPKGQGRGLAPVPPNLWASTRELEERLSYEDPRVRANALAGLVEREGSLALEAVLKALSDDADDVRAAAVDMAVASGVEVPAATLFAVALSDPSPLVRLLTLQAVADHPEVRGVAEQAQFDPDPHVQTQARQILRQFGTASAPGPKRRQ